MSLTASQRKKLQRDRDRALGWVEVTVKISAEHVEALRAFAASLPNPTPPRDERQLDLIDEIERQLSQKGVDGQSDFFK